MFNIPAKRIAFFCAILVLVGIFSFLIFKTFFQSKRSSIQISTSQTQDINFEFEFHTSPSFQLSTINTELLKKVVGKLAEPSNEATFLVFGRTDYQNPNIKPEKVRIVFQEEENIPLKDIFYVSTNGTKVTEGFSAQTTNNDRVVTYIIHLNSETFQNALPSNINLALNNSLFRLLYITVKLKGGPIEPQSFNNIRNELFGPPPGTEMFSVISQTWRDIPLSIAQLLLPSPVYAACTGGWQVGLYENTYKCSSDGSICSAGNEGLQCGNPTYVAPCSCIDDITNANLGSCTGHNSICGQYSSGTCKCTPSYGTCQLFSSYCNASSTYYDCSTMNQSECGNPVFGGGPGSCANNFCVWTGCTWSAWSACSLSCGSGTQTRTGNCGTQTQACNTQACPPIGGGCTPSCSPQCGQADGCGGTCSNSDSGAPGAPPTTNPPNGGAATPDGSNNITITWSAEPKAELYEIQVWPTGTTQNCASANNFCRGPLASRTFTFTRNAAISGYSWRIRATNSTCGSFVGAWTTYTFTIGSTISGNFYLDNNRQATINLATGLCELTGAPLQNPQAGSSMNAVWGGVVSPGTITGSSYTIPGVGADPNTIVTMVPGGSQYNCSCPFGCSYSGLSSPKANVHFFLASGQSSWWQTRNGLLYAGNTSGQAIQSLIPATCTAPNCTPALSLKDSSGTANSTGYAISGGGGIDSTADTNTQTTYLSEDARTERGAGVIFSGPKEDYSYFKQLYSIGSTPTADFNGTKPTSAPSNGRNYYAGGDVTISNAWSVASTEKLVIFVNGNLTINQNITVAKGGFLAFIVKGNVTFGYSVGQAALASTTPVIEGVYIADGQIIVEHNPSGSDLKFIGAGTFVGWGGVQMQRSYSNVLSNNTIPTETFVFRPDFVINIPERMTRPIYLWQETN